MGKVPNLEVLQGARRKPAEVSTRLLGLVVFLASVSALFIATVVGYLIIRFRQDAWGEGLPALPPGLYLSTALLLPLSLSLEIARKGAEAGEERRTRPAIYGAIGCAGAFLIAQGANWWAMVAADVAPDLANLYAFTFYLLTGTHAAHAVGGLVPLYFLARNARAGLYGPGKSEGIKLTAIYWHYLGFVWLTLLAVMMLPG